jgi:alpha-1,3-rhamnosyltransferase
MNSNYKFIKKEDGIMPLVSIIVITYNSSMYVIETLESVRAQTYKNIELIVSDDGSTDSTIEICRSWIEQNKERFARTELLTVNENTGTTANCNRGLKAAKGEWLKFIGGDDLLDISSITSFLQHIADNGSLIKLICCNRVLLHENSQTKETELITNLLSPQKNKQAINYACNRPTIAPFVMIKKDLLLQLGRFDEQYRLLEDAPLFFKAIKKGHFFSLITQNLVYYRVLNKSTSNSQVINGTLLHDIQKFTTKEIVPYIVSRGLFINALKIFIEFKYYSQLRRTLFLKMLNEIAKIERSLYFMITKSR